MTDTAITEDTNEQPRKSGAAVVVKKRAQWSRKLDEPLTTAGKICFGVLMVVSPHLLGGVLGWSVAAIGALAVVTAFLLVRGRYHVLPRKGDWRAYMVAMAALGLTALQAIPLPCAVVEFFQPQRVQTFKAAFLALGEPGKELCTLSASRGATEQEFVKLAAALAAFVAAWVLTMVGQRRFVLTCVAVSVGVMACVALGHLSVNATEVFGIYHPIYAKARILGPLLNDNHLGGFLAMGVPVAVGLATSAASTKKILEAVVWTTVAILAGITTVVTLSRGAIASLLFAGLLMALLMQFGQSGRRGFGRRVPLVLALSGALAGGAYLVSAQVMKAFGGGDLSKLALAGRALLWSFSHPIIGVGRGAFGPGFVEDFGSIQRYTNPENFIVQWASEWGWPLTLALLGVVGSAVYHGVRQSRSSPLRLGAAVGVMGILAHDLVDFSLEMVGISVVAMALLGCLVDPIKGEKRRTDGDEVPARKVTTRKPIRLRRILLYTVGAVGLVTLLVAVRLPFRGGPELEVRLKDTLANGNRVAFANVLHDAVSLYPTEPNFALLAGAEATRHGDATALRWLNLAMRLAPGWASPHVEAARYLVGRGRTPQALMEIRSAAAINVNAPRAFFCQLLRKAPDAEWVSSAAPDNANRLPFLDAAAACIQFAPAEADKVDVQIIEEFPSVVSARVRRSRRLMQAGQLAEAITTLEALSKAHGNESSVWEAYVEGLMLAGRHSEAHKVLEGHQHAFDSPRTYHRLRARAATAAGQGDDMRAAIDELRVLAAGSAEELSRVAVLQGELEDQLRNDARALRSYEDAYRFAPTDRILLRIAMHAEKLGDTGRAFRAYRDLSSRDPNNNRYKAAINRLRRPMIGSSTSERNRTPEQP